MPRKDKLLPCPFCGGDNLVHFYWRENQRFPLIRCFDCLAEIPGKNDDKKGDTAIKAWNTRASEVVK